MKRSVNKKIIFSDNNVKEFKQYNKKNNIKVVIHSNYSINIAQNWDEYSWWIKDLIYEFELADKISAFGIVVHFGKRLNLSLEECYNNMYTSIIYILGMTKKYKNIKLILETSSGQGSETLFNLDNLSRFIKKFKNNIYYNRIGICIDTCHIFAAGYDIRSKKGFDDYIKNFDDLIGLNKLELIHLNDSKGKLNSKVDRHESIGKGEIGFDGLKLFFNYFTFRNVPIILETPLDSYKKEINLLLEIKEN